MKYKVHAIAAFTVSRISFNLGRSVKFESNFFIMVILTYVNVEILIDVIKLRILAHHYVII